ncbi:hypothetical protein [Prauserella oleivorans]
MVKTAGKAMAAVGRSAGGGAGGGGGYTFTPEEIDEVIRQWEDLREGLEDDEREAENVANVQAPGREFASGDFQQAANPSGEALVQQTRRMKQYVEMYIAKLKEAKAGTEAQNEHARDEIKKFGGML